MQRRGTHRRVQSAEKRRACNQSTKHLQKIHTDSDLEVLGVVMSGEADGLGVVDFKTSNRGRQHNTSTNSGAERIDTMLHVVRRAVGAQRGHDVTSVGVDMAMDAKLLHERAWQREKELSSNGELHISSEDITSIAGAK